MKNKFILSTLMLSAVPFAFYKMEEIMSSSFKTNQLISAGYNHSNSFYYDYHTKFVYFGPTHDDYYIHYFETFKQNLVKYPFLVQLPLQISENGGYDEKSIDIIYTALKNNYCPCQIDPGLSLNTLFWMDHDYSKIKFLLIRDRIFNTDSEVTISNNDNKVMIIKNGKSIELKSALLKYYSMDKDIDKIRDAVVNSHQVTKMKVNRPKAFAQSKEPFELIESAFNIRLKSPIINLLKKSEIRTVYRVIENSSKTASILFGMAESKIGEKEKFFWITRIEGDVSNLLKYNKD